MQTETVLKQKFYGWFVDFFQLPKVFGQVRVAVKGTGRTLIQVNF